MESQMRKKAFGVKGKQVCFKQTYQSWKSEHWVTSLRTLKNIREASHHHWPTSDLELSPTWGLIVLGTP